MEVSSAPVLVHFTAKCHSINVDLGVLDASKTTVAGLRAIISDKTSVGLASMKVLGLTKSALRKLTDGELLQDIGLKTKTTSTGTSSSSSGDVATLKCALTVMGNVQEREKEQEACIASNSKLPPQTKTGNGHANTEQPNDVFTAMHSMGQGNGVYGNGGYADNDMAMAISQSMQSMGQGSSISSTNNNNSSSISSEKRKLPSSGVDREGGGDKQNMPRQGEGGPNEEEEDRMVVNDLDCEYAPASAEWLSL